MAIANDHVDTLRELCAVGQFLDNAALRLATYWGSTAVLEFIVAHHGRMLRARGARPAIWATQYGQAGALQILAHAKAAFVVPDEVLGPGRVLSCVMEAIISRDAQVLRVLLGHGADLEVGNLGTPLMHAVEIDQPLLAAMLIGAKASMNARRSHGESVLSVAVRHSTECVKQLLSAKVNVDARVGSDRVLLHTAARVCNAATMALLLCAKVDVNARDGNRRTPLHLAVAPDHAAASLPCVEILLRAKADVHALDVRGHMPLHFALTHCRLPIVPCVAALLGAKADFRSSGAAEPPLHAAVSRLWRGCVRALLQANADPDTPLPGEPALANAASCAADGRTAGLAAGANADEAASARHTTPLHLLLTMTHSDVARARYGSPACAPIMTQYEFARTQRDVQSARVGLAQVLVAAGADMNGGGSHPYIVQAARSCNVDFVSVLVSAKCNINKSDGCGHTALHWAAQLDQVALTTVLILAKADVHVRNAARLMPIHLAVAGANFPCARALMEAGAVLGDLGALEALSPKSSATVRRLLAAQSLAHPLNMAR